MPRSEHWWPATFALMAMLAAAACSEDPQSGQGGGGSPSAGTAGALGGAAGTGAANMGGSVAGAGTGNGGAGASAGSASGGTADGGTPGGGTGGTPTMGGSGGNGAGAGGTSAGSGGTAGSAGGVAGAGGAAGAAGAAGGSGRTIVETIDLVDVWSGHPVNFALVTRDNRQFIAFYDASRNMTVGSRTLGSSTFNYQTLPSVLGWDSHNHVAMALDSAGHVHVAGNMHGVPLIYFRTTTAYDITTLTRVTSMVGMNEATCTYPEFFRGPAGELIFMYRDGGSGNGNHIFNTYNAQTRAWSRLLGSPLTDGQGQRNAYPVGPIQGPDGAFHLVFVWRDTPDATTNHDISYAKSTNLTAWQRGNGQALPLPITLATSDVVDPVPINAGMINNNTKVGFDAQNRPIVGYHKYDQSGATQLYNARLENGNWVPRQTTDWTYRWDFGGGGTLVFAIELDGVRVRASDGALVQDYYHAVHGGRGTLRLDPDTLRAVETLPPDVPYPVSLDVPQAPTAGMVVRWARDSGQSPDATITYLLRWETLESNRDMPRDPIPPPTRLRLYGFR